VISTGQDQQAMHDVRGSKHLGAGGHFAIDDAIANKLERRLGRLHAKQRLGIEKDHEAQIFGQGILPHTGTQFIR
jgi:hypothetical protein